MLKQIRDAAITCQDILLRFQLREAADNLQVAIVRFHAEGTSEALTDVVGGWAHGLRLMNQINNGAPAGTDEGAFTLAIGHSCLPDAGITREP